MSVVSFYYYLQVLKRIYVEKPNDDTSDFRVSMVTQALLCLIALAVVVLGCVPNLLAAIYNKCAAERRFVAALSRTSTPRTSQKVGAAQGRM